MKKEVPFTIKLSTEIDTGRVKDNEPVIINEIVIKRRPTGNDLRTFRLDSQNMDDFLRIVSKLSDIEIGVLRKAEADDCLVMVEAVADFFVTD